MASMCEEPLTLDDENDAALRSAALGVLLSGLETPPLEPAFSVVEPLPYDTIFFKLASNRDTTKLISDLDHNGRALAEAVKASDDERIAVAAGPIRAGLRRLELSIDACEANVAEGADFGALANAWTSPLEKRKTAKAAATRYGVKTVKTKVPLKLLRVAIALDASAALAHEAMARERLATTRLSAALAGAPERAAEQLEALKVCGAALKSAAGLWDCATGVGSAISTLDELSVDETKDYTKPQSRSPEATRCVCVALAARATSMAQRCAIATAVATNKPASLVARLCEAAAERIRTASETSSKGAPGHHARLRVSLNQDLEALEAVAALYSALAARKVPGYGVYIGWLGVSSSKAPAGPLANAVREALRIAVAANSAVYFEKVLSPAELEAPSAMLLMKPEKPPDSHESTVLLRPRALTDEELAQRLHDQLNLPEKR